MAKKKTAAKKNVKKIVAAKKPAKNIIKAGHTCEFC